MRAHIDGIYYDIDIEAQTAKVMSYEYNHRREGNKYRGDIIIPSKVNYNETIFDVLEVECGAFQGSSITSIELPSSVQCIGVSAFKDCVNLKSVTLPNNIGIIDRDTFRNCKNLTHIEIPDSIAHIGPWAFYACSKLNDIRFPRGLRSIGSYAFANCDRLTSIFIPQNVYCIGDCAFRSCENLQSIDVAGDNISFLSKDGVLFNKNRLQKLLQYPGGKTGTYKVPDIVKYIEEYAFEGCKLTSIILSNNITYIPKGVFASSKKLISVELSDNINKIDETAFHNCPLINLTLLKETMEEKMKQKKIREIEQEIEEALMMFPQEVDNVKEETYTTEIDLDNLPGIY